MAPIGRKRPVCFSAGRAGTPTLPIGQHLCPLNLFVTWSAATDRVHETVAIRDFPIGDLHPNRQQQVRSAFALGVIGILYLNEDAGWSFSPPMWLPLTDDELSAPQIDGG